MRQIALGLLCSAALTTSAFAQEPPKLSLRTDRALAGESFLTPVRTLTLSAAPAAAQAAAADEPAVKVLVGADIPSVYYFRGYRQEVDAKFTFQPYADVGFAAGEGVNVNLGIWNSLHTGSLKDSDLGWYETDYYAAVSVGMVKATYTAYTYPKVEGPDAIHELMFSTTFDDSASAFPLAPSAAIAFEFAKPEGIDKGIYLELGVTPAIPLADDAPVAISIPVKVGLSLKDYYGEDTFGYVSAGVSVSVPINDKFEVHGSVLGYGFGSDVLKNYNQTDKSGDVVASVGFGISF
jgi:hypothetical protein